MIVGIDMGHTLSGAGTGASGYAEETDRNRAVGKRLIQMLTEKKHKVVNCTVDKSSNDLKDRVALANKQELDLFVSLHLNAFAKSSAHGVETYAYATSGKGWVYCKSVQSELVKATGMYDRGSKTANFYVLKYTKAPAILVELGFCTNKTDMTTKWNTEKIAAALFKGITGTVYVAPKPPSGTLYGVSCGSFSSKSNAITRQKELKAEGVDSFLEAFKKDGKVFYRAICGSYSNKANAEALVARLKKLGYDAFIILR